jgi:hypothetical protein
LRGTGGDEEAEAEDTAGPAEKEKQLRDDDAEGTADRAAKLQDAELP